MSTPETFGQEGTPQAQSFFERFIGVFISPRETMENIAARPTWVIPLIVITLASGLSGYLLQDVIYDTQLEQMQKNPDLSEAQISQAAAMMKTMIPITSVVAPLLVVPIVYVIIAGLLIFAGNVILGGESHFKTVFSTTCWAGIVSLVGTIVNVPVMLSSGVMESAAGLQILLPREEGDSLFYYFLTQIDLFMLWWVAITGFGFAAAYKFATKKAMTTVFVMWGIYVVIAVGIKSVFS